MLSKEVVELSKQHSIIRDIFEYGMKRAKEVGAENVDRKSTRLNSSHLEQSRMPSSA